MAAHRCAPRRPRQSLLLDPLRARPAPAVGERHRPAGAAREPHLGDAAAHRHDRRALHDPARPDIRLMHSARRLLELSHVLYRRTGTHFAGTCELAHVLYRRTGTHFAGTCDLAHVLYWRTGIHFAGT